jgi:DNA-binding Lrp family transcriptional regulator
MLFRKQDKPADLLCDLVKNSRRSNRDLAKTPNSSQSSVSRLIKVLEKEAMLQYTSILNFSYLGFDVVASTFYVMAESSQYLKEKAEKWMNTQSNVVFSSKGERIEADTVVISMHSDYADFSEFQQL